VPKQNMVEVVVPEIKRFDPMPELNVRDAMIAEAIIDAVANIPAKDRPIFIRLVRRLF
jgi:hypothetical protein